MDFILSFLCNQEIPTLAQNIGLAALSMLIPLAIAIFPSSSDFQDLDKHVVLDHVLKVKGILIYSALIFIPFLFWSSVSLDMRIIFLGLWSLGIYLLVSILGRAYQWLKGNKFSLRFSYLKGMPIGKDMEESWGSVWGSDLNPQNEKEFFDVFATRIDTLLSHE